MRIVTFLVLAVLAWGCGSEAESNTTTAAALPSLESLQEAYKADPSESNAKALISAYQQEISEVSGDSEKAASLAKQAGQVALDHKQFLPAIAVLTNAVRNHFSASVTADNVLALAGAYEQTNQNNIANTIYQSFAQSFSTHAKAGEIEQKVSALPTLAVRMDTLHGQVYNDSLQQLDYQVAQDYITCSELHSTMLSQSADSPAYIQKAAEIARALRNYSKALDLYEEVLAKYPNSSQAEQALFLSAFTLDNDMKKLNEARAKYEAFLAKYPKSDFADDTQFLLDNLGKDEEEIIQQLQEQ